jgi:hypothetical protein
MNGVFGFIDGIRTTLRPRRSASRKKKQAGRAIRRPVRLALEEFEPRTLLSGMTDMQAVMNLVPDSAITDTAAVNGNWSSPSTWASGHVPAAKANVDIPMGLTVTVDTAITARLHTIRVDGSLQFATNANTSLLVDTIVVTMMGTLNIGTAASPIAAANTATITFSDSAPISTSWDPLLFGRGLISMGTVNMYGQTVTPYEALTGLGAAAGSTVLNLAQAPTGWNVGDQLMLPGTNQALNQDESLTIQAISSTQVTVSALAYDHLAPSTGLTVYVANLRRNVVLQSEKPSDIKGHGHVMFMTATVNIVYVSLVNLGRTNKLIPVTDPRLDSYGHLIPSTGKNARGRYAIHFHHTGTDATTTPASVVGTVVNGSPGWGFVNHDSYVNFSYDVSYNVVGSGFVTESGDEIGSFTNDFAIRDTGLGGNPDQRVKLQDFGVDGDGFWMQGPGVAVMNNIATGQTGFGFIYYSQGLKNLLTGVVTQFAAANLPDPSWANGQPYVNVEDVPITLDDGNVTYGSSQGSGYWYNTGELAPTVGSCFDNYTAWNIQNFGATFLYTSHVMLENSWLLGNLTSPVNSNEGVRTGIEAMNDINFINDRVEGWNFGLRLATVGTQTVVGGFYNAIHSIEVRLSNQPAGSSISISGSVVFGTLTPDQLGGKTQYNIFMNSDAELIDKVSAFPFYFVGQPLSLGLVQYNGQQLYFNEQAASYIPFVAGQAASWVPAQLIGLTNQQLWNQYGIAFAGAIAPSSATTVAGLYGLLGPATTYSPTYTLKSAVETAILTGYQLKYVDANGNTVIYPTLFTLVPGWNLLTITISGTTTTFFVYGGTF